MDEKELMEAMKALAQPTRLRIIRLLAHKPQGALAGEIAAALAVRQNTLSSHIAALANAGLIQGQRRGRGIVYKLDKAHARQIGTEINASLKV
jgi:ArsR family transcriptional regulator, arsenate/arsenite/antimonite-responsive transcriptional repressor